VMNALMKVEEGVLDDILGQRLVLGDEKSGPDGPHLVAMHQGFQSTDVAGLHAADGSWSSRVIPGMVARIGNTRSRAERLGGVSAEVIIRGAARIRQGAGSRGGPYQDRSSPDPEPGLPAPLRWRGG